LGEEGGVRVLEKRRGPGEGLRMMLEQTIAFPKPIRAWNPRGFMEEKTKMDVVFDASIPESQYSSYEAFSVGKDSKGKIIILLACLGYSYPTTAIAEATGVATSTTKRLLWELKRDGLLEGAFSSGAYVDSDIWPYRYGPLREGYWMLSPNGSRAAEDLMRTKVVPLAPPRELVEKEREEHPWLTPEEAEKIVRDHLEETRRRVEEIRRKQARGEELTAEELKVIYGERAVLEEARKEREVAERPWEAAGRKAEEERRRIEKK